MDTFLVTYRYFTTGKFVLQSLINFYRQLEEERTGKRHQDPNFQKEIVNNNNNDEEKKDQNQGRKISMYFVIYVWNMKN